jgi:hypothetical protein
MKDTYPFGGVEPDRGVKDVDFPTRNQDSTTDDFLKRRKGSARQQPRECSEPKKA